MTEQVGPPAPNVLETEVGGDISLYDAQTEKVLVLNGTASDIWRLCDGEHTVDQIVTLLAQAYGEPEEPIRPQVLDTIETLVSEGFLPAGATA